jgi:hypothetical protein
MTGVSHVLAHVIKLGNYIIVITYAIWLYKEMHLRSIRFSLEVRIHNTLTVSRRDTSLSKYKM